MRIGFAQLVGLPALAAMLFVAPEMSLADPPAAASATEPQAAADGKNTKKAPLDQAALEQEFCEKLSGVMLVGSFTTVDANGEQPLSQDKYTIEKVRPRKNGFFTFDVRIQYNDRDTRMSLSFEVKWAGDTPVITLTNVLVPGMGTFTARVLFYGDQYAGTWSGGDHGGHMYGKIVKLDAAEAKPATEAPAGDAAKPAAAASPASEAK